MIVFVGLRRPSLLVELLTRWFLNGGSFRNQSRIQGSFRSKKRSKWLLEPFFLSVFNVVPLHGRSTSCIIFYVVGSVGGIDNRWNLNLHLTGGLSFMGVSSSVWWTIFHFRYKGLFNHCEGGLNGCYDGGRRCRRWEERRILREGGRSVKLSSSSSWFDGRFSAD